jgi:predicted phage terminase large subunit-like protein
VVSEEDWIDLLEREILDQTGEGEEDYETPLDLAKSLDPAYVARAHLTYLSDRLAAAVRDVEAGHDRFVVVSMPPRLGKSQMTSVEFMVWLLRRHPDWETMLLSHAPDLASGWGRQIRRRVEENPQLGLEVAKDAGAVTDWEIAKTTTELADGTKETTGGGVVLSKSIRQSVTGRGAKVMVLDDVVKDFADAHSKSSRDFVWDWWTSNSRTRLHPPALVVVIGTRWHEDDIIGRLLSPEYDGDPSEWEVISFPAIAEELYREPTTGRVVDAAEMGRLRGDDEPPWEAVPDVLGREPGQPLLSPIVKETEEQALTRWQRIRRAVGTYTWNALYQQRPSPAKGTIFQSDWWMYWRPGDWDVIDEFFDRRITVLDAAFKKTDDSDYVVMQEWGARGADRYLIRQRRDRLSFTETVSEYRDFIGEAEGAGVHEHVVEDKANGSAVIDTLKAEIPGIVAWSPGTDSKEARARAVSPQVEGRQTYLPALADWLPDYVAELAGFPNGANDDQVDGTSMALLRLRATGAVVTLVPQATINRGYQRSSVPGGSAGARGGAPGRLGGVVRRARGG